MKYDFFNVKGNTSLEYDILMSLGMKSAALFYLDKNLSPTERAAKVLYESFRCLKTFNVINGLPDDVVDRPDNIPPDMPFDNRVGCDRLRVSYRSLTVRMPVIDDDTGFELGLYVDYEGRVMCDQKRFTEKVLSKYPEDTIEHTLLKQIMTDSTVPVEITPARYLHFGTHRVADTEFLLNHGYKGYIQKIKCEMESADSSKLSFLRGLIYTAEAFCEYAMKCSDHYAKIYKTSGDPMYLRISKALKRVPENPCESFYEGILVIRLLTILVHAEIGRIDKILNGLYTQDIKKGAITKEEAVNLINQLFRFIDESGAIWHTVIGGCDRNGEPVYNDLTRIILKDVAPFAHPHLTLRVNDKMPEDIWDLAMARIGSGTGNPALVNEEIFINDLVRSYNVTLEDARDFAFGGCSETLIPGCTNVDSTWVAFNALDVFNNCVYRNLSKCKSYKEFYDILVADFERCIDEMVNHINIRQHLKAAFLPDPINSLHQRGCIESGKAFWEGGSIYNFDSANIYGLTNVVNSLRAIKAFFEGELDIDTDRLISAMKNNFANTPQLFTKLKHLPKFGNGDEWLRNTAREFITKIFDYIRSKRCYRGNGHFMPAIVLFTRYNLLGKRTGASLDGRLSTMPLCDCCGATAGTDLNGPTALMYDAAALPHEQGAGTYVLNVKLNPECFASKESIEKVKALCRGYFKMKGSQIQINVVDAATLKDAYEHPDRHRDLIVRIGGFTDYYYNQAREIQKVILDRVEHKV